ncbi:hypothetical protein Tco_0801225 [Tanacetum coccineum]|uniref:Uncharacterized protein n=1 Tax=Tanacetum coccineum TaxID=301880 RepID=A0ABQ4ZZH3_9ASTR
MRRIADQNEYAVLDRRLDTPYRVVDQNSGLELVSIRRIQGIGYDLLGFLGIGTTFDIFQNILFPYSLNTAYCLSWIWRIGLVSFMVFAETVTTSNKLDLLFSPMFDELLNGTTPVMSKSSVVHAADAPNQRQQQNTTPSTSTIVVADTPPLNIQTTPETTSQAPTQAPTVTPTDNINQAETPK